MTVSTKTSSVGSSSSGDWQPIETAPKDGTHIIGLCRAGGAREIWWKRDTYEGEYWQDDFDSEPEPTHWVPFPRFSSGQSRPDETQESAPENSGLQNDFLTRRFMERK